MRIGRLGPGRGRTPARSAPLDPRLRTMFVSGLGLLALLMVMVFIPVPYAIERPGPTVDTLGGGTEDSSLISIDGAQTYDTDGELRLTTVSTSGGPGYPVRAGEVLTSWWAPEQRVVPVEERFATDDTQEELAEISSMLMTSSQVNAATAALESLGHDLDMTLHIAGTSEGSNAEGVVEPEDTLHSITNPEGQRLETPSYSELLDMLEEVEPGSTVALELERDGEVIEADVTTGEPVPPFPGANPPDGSMLGILVAPDVDLPFDIDFAIDRIGGPSAGTMFALAIIDLLTEESLSGDHVIAGTGTMDAAGRVGPIGGIIFKMWGSLADGATHFLAPALNCNEVVGNIPDGLEVFAVDTLDEAREAVESIADGDTSTLRSCADVVEEATS